MVTVVVPSKPEENEEKPPKSVCLQDLSRVREEAEMEMAMETAPIGVRANNGTQSSDGECFVLRTPFPVSPDR